jgi:cytochrome c-type biogenesis protein CcmE
MNEIVKFLKINGESLDDDIAKAIGMSLPKVRIELSELTANGDVMCYQSTKYVDGKKIEGTRCRIAGIVPQSAPGRKSAKVNLKLS